MERAKALLYGLQEPDGHWCAELEGDTILESEYILTLHYLGRSGEERARKCAQYIRKKQNPEGAWSSYPGGPTDVSVSTKAYFVLKLLGDDPNSPAMARARESILEAGGIEGCNSFTKIYLAIFGQYSWNDCPAVPPGMIFLPRWFYFNIYAMSSWSRAIVVPLSIIWAHRPRCAVPAHADIPELFATNPGAAIPAKNSRWARFFTRVDKTLKVVDRALPWKPFRKSALRRAERWILERLQKSDGLGAIFPPIINTLIAFRCLGYSLDDPIMQSQVKELEKLEIEEGDTLRIQPCFSPIWDTAIGLNSLIAAGEDPSDPRLLKAAQWLVDREVRDEGDWKVHCPEAEPGGWYFEYANEFYPDCDDTAEVLLALSKVHFPDPDQRAGCAAAMERGKRWLRAMQNDDGGWGAFDKNCDREVLTHIPFADHNAMIDPSCEDITARALEAFHEIGMDSSDPTIVAAVRFLESKQDPDGTWYGRWGCNYVYGTWLALWGLRCVGYDMSAPRVQAAARWIESHQNADGGWGELPASYDDPATKGVGPSTACQTAWAVMALIAAGHRSAQATEAGIEFLIKTQEPDGSWYDHWWTGTGFPTVFYLRYHLYAVHFPLLALAAAEDRAA